MVDTDKIEKINANSQPCFDSDVLRGLKSIASDVKVRSRLLLLAPTQCNFRALNQIMNAKPHITLRSSLCRI